jgi:hypothetical protein
MRTNRIIFVGAGFSALAGLPLGAQLFLAIRRDIAATYGGDSQFEEDLANYLCYRERCEGNPLGADDVDMEDFLSFLDIEHSLGLRGKDTWSVEGNQAQIMIRRSIGKILLSRMPERLPDAYKRFAEGLTAHDWVFTFNYDIILERAMEAVGLPFRRFPNRNLEIGPLSEIPDNRDELVLLKLHGSLDWFDRSGFDEQVTVANAFPKPHVPRHSIFGANKFIPCVPLVEGPRDVDDPLKNIYRITRPHLFYDEGVQDCAPFILSPSHSKLLYIRPLSRFFRSLGKFGVQELGLSIVGYSLPQHDDYARQILYRMATNYQHHLPDLVSGEGLGKTPVRILDFQSDESGTESLRGRYRFLDWTRTELWTSGFTEEAVDWVLAPNRIAD